jgi:hypothetical protein
MAQINQWDGGLSTRLNPTLININEGIVYSNIDSSAGTLKPLREDIYTNQIEKPYLYYFNNWIYSNNYRNYIEFQERLYYSDGISIPQKTTDGNTWYNLGIAQPTLAPITTINGSGVHTGTLQYCYTYYNSNDGSESAPSLYSAELVVATNKVDITLVASVDTQVTGIKLYRLGASLTSMFLVTTLPNLSQTYSDNIADIDIEGFPLQTANSGQAKVGLKYLTESNAMLFGAIGDKLYFSEIANVNSWGPFNFLDFSEPITGIGAIQNGLVVFSFNRAYIVVGNSPTTFSKYLVSGNQGCVNHNTIRFINNTLVWLSNDGVCASNGGDVQVITKDKLGLAPLGEPRDSIVYNEVYYLSLQSYTLALDFKQNLLFRTLSIMPSNFHIHTDKLYYSLEGPIYILEQDMSKYKTIIYKSGNIGEGSLTNLKKYNSFYTNSLGSLILRIFIDGKQVFAGIIEEGFNEILVPIIAQLGYYMSYGIEGTGELLELEYKAEGRQNGR